MRDIQAKVISNREVARHTYLLMLECPMEPVRPGQFVMLKTGMGRDPLLRRPLGILSYQADVLALLYKVKGAGTHMLSRLQETDHVMVLGPLGNGFSPPHAESDIIYVAGGTGLPPILALAGYLKRGTLFFGARSEADIPFECLPRETRIVTEDGSYGERGLVTTIVTQALGERQAMFYACGPLGMLKAVSQLVGQGGSRCQVSLEERMACGFGVCSGCAVETVTGIRRVCTDGPVFNTEEIVW